MSTDTDRAGRAGKYILGLMDNIERERAERDLEIDAAFRDAVMQLAARMHLFDHPGMQGAGQDERWKLIAERIASLPQMRFTVTDPAPTGKPVITGVDRKPYGIGLHSIQNARGLAIALALIAAFVLGCLVGRLWV